MDKDKIKKIKLIKKYIDNVLENINEDEINIESINKLLKCYNIIYSESNKTKTPNNTPKNIDELYKNFMSNNLEFNYYLKKDKMINYESSYNY
jgi:hypothetical protein